MKHQEKNKKAKEILELLNNGSSMNDVRALLEQENLYQADITSILILAENMFQDQYKDQIVSYVHEGTLAEHRSEFSQLSDDQILKLEQFAIKEIQRSSRAQVNKMAKAGKSNTEIIKAVANKYYTTNDVSKQIQHYKDFFELPEASVRWEYITIGSLSLVCGLLLFWIFSNQNRLYLKLSSIPVGIGIVYLYKAFTPPGVVKRNKENSAY